MQHNSFAGRELLSRLNNNPIVRERREPHRNIDLSAPYQATEKQIALSGEWNLAYDKTDESAVLVADDFRDFLTRGGIQLSENATQTLTLGYGEIEEGFAVSVEAGNISLQGADIAALWAAVVFVENELRTAGAPVLNRGETRREPAWELQISSPAWGANLFVPDLTEEYLSDDSFRLMAHHGINGFLLFGEWGVYATGTKLPELEHPDAERHLEVLAEAAKRALRYGIRFYYCAIGPLLLESHPVFQRLPEIRGARVEWASGNGEGQYCLCSSEPNSLEFQTTALSNIFARVPELGGLLAIVGGEAFYHCYTRPADTRMGETNCPRCSAQPAEVIIANYMETITNAIHKVAPHAPVMAWPYSAQKVWSKDYNQLEFIDRLSPEVTFMSDIDMGQFYQKDGYVKEIWDYSIDYDRPADRIISQNLRCGRRGLDMVVSTDAAHGNELLGFPYVPALPRMGRRWQGIRSLRPYGSLIRWGCIGIFNSVADRLSYEALWNPNFAPEASSLAIAQCLCGSAAPDVMEAWRYFDRAVGHLPVLTLTGYYHGPMWLGPAHPLATWEGETPEVFTAACRLDVQGCDPNTEGMRTVRDDLVLSSMRQLFGDEAPTVHPDDQPDVPIATHAGLDLLLNEYTAARDLARFGWDKLQNIDVTQLSAAAQAEVEEQRIMGEYLYRTLRTTLNTIRFIGLKASGRDANEELLTVANDELDNTKIARLLYERAPWLNLNLRLDGAFPDCLLLLDAKLERIEEYIQNAKA